MAGAKIIKKRISSVKNTRKITRTMEMVSTAKSKKLIDRVNEAKPYGDKLREIMESLAGQGGNVDSPYLRVEDHPKRVALVVVTANRGLCGGYNANVQRMARQYYVKLTEQGKNVDVFMIGKKGQSFFRFMKVPMKETYLEFDDTFTYDHADALATMLMRDFAGSKYDRVEIVSTIYYSAGSQKPGITQLLPVGLGESESTDDAEEATQVKADPDVAAGGPVLYEPEPAIIAEKMIPLAIKTTLYRMLLEAVASEQIARRIAMKNATDAAGEMVKQLTRTYNRARQAGITQEILEIVGGADAL